MGEQSAGGLLDIRDAYFVRDERWLVASRRE